MCKTLGPFDFNILNDFSKKFSLTESKYLQRTSKECKGLLKFSF